MNHISFPIQKSELDSVKSSPSHLVNSASDVNATPSISTELQEKIAKLEGEKQTLQHQMEQKDEEIKLYKGKYEDTAKQVAELVCIVSYSKSSCL